nr:Fe-S oxidoreductase [Burkholderiaceae bacterium]
MTAREGSLEAPTRHPLDWKNPEFYDESKALAEMERVFDICHGCRRCVSLCNAFPTLFDLVDASESLEVDGVDKKDYWKVVDQCYLCDVCYMTKCPYVPPHPWNLDFPHLMLRAKAIQFKQGTPTKFRDTALSSTDRNGKLATIPVVVQLVNKAKENATLRQFGEDAVGVHHN